MDFDHLGFVVKDIVQSAANFEKNYGMKTVTSIIFDKTQKVKVQFLSFAISDAFKIELIEPIGLDSPVRNFLEKGGGLHHIAFSVENMDESIKTALMNPKIRLIAGPTPGAGHENRLISFLYNSQDFPHCHIVELVEKPNVDISK